jgi:hypothetical protein
MEIVTLFYDHLVYFKAIWYILWQCGIVCGHLVYFPLFLYVWTEKNLATLYRMYIPKPRIEWFSVRALQ